MQFFSTLMILLCLGTLNAAEPVEDPTDVLNAARAFQKTLAKDQPTESKKKELEKAARQKIYLEDPSAPVRKPYRGSKKPDVPPEFLLLNLDFESPELNIPAALKQKEHVWNFLNERDAYRKRVKSHEENEEKAWVESRKKFLKRPLAQTAYEILKQVGVKGDPDLIYWGEFTDDPSEIDKNALDVAVAGGPNARQELNLDIEFIDAIRTEDELAALIARKLSTINPSITYGNREAPEFEELLLQIGVSASQDSAHRDIIRRDLSTVSRLISGKYNPWAYYKLIERLMKLRTDYKAGKLEGWVGVTSPRELFSKESPIPELRLAAMKNFITFVGQSKVDLSKLTQSAIRLSPADNRFLFKERLFSQQSVYKQSVRLAQLAAIGGVVFLVYRGWPFISTRVSSTWTEFAGKYFSKESSSELATATPESSNGPSALRQIGSQLGDWARDSLEFVSSHQTEIYAGGGALVALGASYLIYKYRAPLALFLKNFGQAIGNAGAALKNASLGLIENLKNKLEAIQKPQVPPVRRALEIEAKVENEVENEDENKVEVFEAKPPGPSLFRLSLRAIQLKSSQIASSFVTHTQSAWRSLSTWGTSAAKATKRSAGIAASRTRVGLQTGTKATTEFGRRAGLKTQALSISALNQTRVFFSWMKAASGRAFVATYKFSIKATLWILSTGWKFIQWSAGQLKRFGIATGEALWDFTKYVFRGLYKGGVLFIGRIAELSPKAFYGAIDLMSSDRAGARRRSSQNSASPDALLESENLKVLELKLLAEGSNWRKRRLLRKILNRSLGILDSSPKEFRSKILSDQVLVFIYSLSFWKDYRVRHAIEEIFQGTEASSLSDAFKPVIAAADLVRFESLSLDRRLEILSVLGSSKYGELHPQLQSRIPEFIRNLFSAEATSLGADFWKSFKAFIESSSPISQMFSQEFIFHWAELSGDDPLLSQARPSAELSQAHDLILASILQRIGGTIDNFINSDFGKVTYQFREELFQLRVNSWSESDREMLFASLRARAFSFEDKYLYGPGLIEILLLISPPIESLGENLFDIPLDGKLEPSKYVFILNQRANLARLSSAEQLRLYRILASHKLDPQAGIVLKELIHSSSKVVQILTDATISREDREWWLANAHLGFTLEFVVNAPQAMNLLDALGRQGLALALSKEFRKGLIDKIVEDMKLTYAVYQSNRDSSKPIKFILLAPKYLRQLRARLHELEGLESQLKVEAFSQLSLVFSKIQDTEFLLELGRVSPWIADFLSMPPEEVLESPYCLLPQKLALLENPKASAELKLELLTSKEGRGIEDQGRWLKKFEASISQAVYSSATSPQMLKSYIEFVARISSGHLEFSPSASLAQFLPEEASQEYAEAAKEFRAARVKSFSKELHQLTDQFRSKIHRFKVAIKMIRRKGRLLSTTERKLVFEAERPSFEEWFKESNREGRKFGLLVRLAKLTDLLLGTEWSSGLSFSDLQKYPENQRALLGAALLGHRSPRYATLLTALSISDLTIAADSLLQLQLPDSAGAIFDRALPQIIVYITDNILSSPDLEARANRLPDAYKLLFEEREAKIEPVPERMLDDSFMKKAASAFFAALKRNSRLIRSPSIGRLEEYFGNQIAKYFTDSLIRLNPSPSAKQRPRVKARVEEIFQKLQGYFDLMPEASQKMLVRVLQAKLWADLSRESLASDLLRQALAGFWLKTVNEDSEESKIVTVREGNFTDLVQLLKSVDSTKVKTVHRIGQIRELVRMHSFSLAASLFEQHMFRLAKEVLSANADPKGIVEFLKAFTEVNLKRVSDSSSEGLFDNPTSSQSGDAMIVNLLEDSMGESLEYRLALLSLVAEIPLSDSPEERKAGEASLHKSVIEDLDKKIKNVRELRDYLRFELGPRNAILKNLTLDFFKVLIAHPEWIQSMDDFNALIEVDQFWPEQGAFGHSYTEAEKFLIQAIDKQKAKFPEFWRYEPAAAEQLHDYALHVLKADKRLENLFDAKLDVWLRLTKRGVTSVTDQLFHDLFEMGDHRQREQLETFAVQGRIWEQQLKARLARQRLQKDMDYVYLIETRKFSSEEVGDEREKHLEALIAKLRTWLPERGIRYAEILEHIAQSIESDLDETKIIDRAKKGSVSEKEEDMGYKVIEELFKRAWTWDKEEQWALILFLRGDGNPTEHLRTQFKSVGIERVRRLFSLLPTVVRAGLLDFFIASSKGLVGSLDQEDSYSPKIISHLLSKSRPQAQKVANQMLEAFLYALKETGNAPMQSWVLGYLLAFLPEDRSNANGQILKDILEVFGTTGVKIGQLLSASGLLPDEDVAILEDLTDRAHPPTRMGIYNDLNAILDPKPIPFKIGALLGSASLKYAVDALDVKSIAQFVLKVVRESSVVHTKVEFDMLDIMIQYLQDKFGGYGIFGAIVRAARQAVERELITKREVENSEKIRANFYHNQSRPHVSVKVPREIWMDDRLLASEFAPGGSFRELGPRAQALAASHIIQMEMENLFRAAPFIYFDPDRHFGNYRIEATREGGELNLLISPIDFGQVLELRDYGRRDIIDLFALAQIVKHGGVTNYLIDKLGKIERTFSLDSQKLRAALKKNFKAGEEMKEVTAYYALLASLEEAGSKQPIERFDFIRAILQLEKYARFLPAGSVKKPTEVLRENVNEASIEILKDMEENILKTDGIRGRVIKKRLSLARQNLESSLATKCAADLSKLSADKKEAQSK